MNGCPDVTILVVAKAPVPGAVKTRLAAELGAVGAARIAAAALLDTLLVCGPVFRHRVLALAGELADTEAIDTSQLRRAAADWQVIGQCSGDLGARLAKAHVDAAELTRTTQGGQGRVLQIGMDTPHVSAGLLEESAHLLCETGIDAVLGPAEDGGWWVCGTSAPAQAATLAGVAMSRPDTGDRTLAALRSAGTRVGLVPALRDLDTFDDAKVITAEHFGLRVSAEFRTQGVG